MSSRYREMFAWVVVGILNHRTERGASLVEYALLLGLIAVVCVGAISLVGGATDSSLSKTGSAFR